MSEHEDKAETHAAELVALPSVPDSENLESSTQQASPRHEGAVVEGESIKLDQEPTPSITPAAAQEAHTDAHKADLETPVHASTQEITNVGASGVDELASEKLPETDKEKPVVHEYAPHTPAVHDGAQDAPVHESTTNVESAHVEAHAISVSAPPDSAPTEQEATSTKEQSQLTKEKSPRHRLEGHAAVKIEDEAVSNVPDEISSSPANPANPTNPAPKEETMMVSDIAQELSQELKHTKEKLDNNQGLREKLEQESKHESAPAVVSEEKATETSQQEHVAPKEPTPAPPVSEHSEHVSAPTSEPTPQAPADTNIPPSSEHTPVPTVPSDSESIKPSTPTEPSAPAEPSIPKELPTPQEPPANVPTPAVAHPEPAKVAKESPKPQTPILGGLPADSPSRTRQLNRYGSVQVMAQPKKASPMLTRQFSGTNLGRKASKKYTSELSLPTPSKKVAAKAPIVIDTGSCFIKAGISGESLPRLVLPPVVGRTGDAASKNEQKHIGFKAWQVEGARLSNIVNLQKSTIDWDSLTDLYEFLFTDELQVNTEEHPLLITELPDTTKASKEKLAEMMFEYFNIPALHIANQAVMALYSMGMVSGVVVDCGNRMQIVPIVDGYVIDSARFQILPGNLTEYFSRLLTEQGLYFSTQLQLNTVRKLKEKYCYVAANYEDELEKYEDDPEDNEQEYTLPDGQSIFLGSQRFRCPETMFRPSLLGLDRKGVHENLFDAVQKCPIDYRSMLYSKIVLSGGSTLFPGFADRLKSEIVKLIPGNASRSVNVIARNNRKYSAWFGGSVFSSLPFFNDACVTKEEWDEDGPACLEKS